MNYLFTKLYWFAMLMLLAHAHVYVVEHASDERTLLKLSNVEQTVSQCAHVLYSAGYVNIHLNSETESMEKCHRGFIGRLKSDQIYRRRFCVTIALCYSYTTLVMY